MVEYTRRQEEIIAAAIELTAEGSIHEFTLKNLASKLGLSEPAIYRHFKDKMAILEAILQQIENENEKLFAEAAESDINPLQKIESIFKYRINSFAEHPSYAAVIFSEEIFLNDPRLVQKVAGIMTETQKIMMKILSSAETSGLLREGIDIKHIALIIMGSLRLLVKKWHMSRNGFDLVEEASLLWTSLEILISAK